MGIVIKNIVLEKLNFKKTLLAPDNTTYNYRFRIGNKLDENDKTAQVMLELEMSGKDDGLKVEICMVGLFELPEHMPLPTEDFLNINAPAAIFPYIREIVSNLMLRANLNPVFVPMINFKEVYENKQKELKEKE